MKLSLVAFAALGLAGADPNHAGCDAIGQLWENILQEYPELEGEDFTDNIHCGVAGQCCDIHDGCISEYCPNVMPGCEADHFFPDNTGNGGGGTHETHDCTAGCFNAISYPEKPLACDQCHHPIWSDPDYWGGISPTSGKPYDCEKCRACQVEVTDCFVKALARQMDPDSGSDAFYGPSQCCSSTAPNPPSPTPTPIDPYGGYEGRRRLGSFMNNGGEQHAEYDYIDQDNFKHDFCDFPNVCMDMCRRTLGNSGASGTVIYDPCECIRRAQELDGEDGPAEPCQIYTNNPVTGQPELGPNPNAPTPCDNSNKCIIWDPWLLESDRKQCQCPEKLGVKRDEPGFTSYCDPFCPCPRSCEECQHPNELANPNHVPPHVGSYPTPYRDELYGPYWGICRFAVDHINGGYLNQDDCGPRCGNGQLEDGEECDPGILPNRNFVETCQDYFNGFKDQHGRQTCGYPECTSECTWNWNVCATRRDNNECCASGAVDPNSHDLDACYDTCDPDKARETEGYPCPDDRTARIDDDGFIVCVCDTAADNGGTMGSGAMGDDGGMGGMGDDGGMGGMGGIRRRKLTAAQCLCAPGL